MNIACGLTVAPGWINVDGSLNAAIARWPRSVLRRIHPMVRSSVTFSTEHYLDALSTGHWVHHELRNGLPFDDGTVDFLYCSHFLEHLSPPDGAEMLAECRRVMKPGGVTRMVVPDLAIAFDWYQDGHDRDELLQCFFFTGSDEYSTHKHAYDFESLAEAMSGAGFSEVHRRSYREGLTPDLERLDNRPDFSLYVEAIA